MEQLRGRSKRVQIDAERVLFVHAHPDDESISTGGTIALLVDAGAHVTVLTCTRGEKGEVIDPTLAQLAESESVLAARRETELAAALGILGVTDHRFLGDPGARWPGRVPRRYLDSGMKWGSRRPELPDSIEPDSFYAADFGEAAADIAAVISDIQPDVVVSYDDWGGYGHPDHIRAHEVTRRAAEVMGVAFYAVETAETDAPVVVDVTPVFDRKRRALQAHRSQIVVRGDEFALEPDAFSPIERVERFRRVLREPESGAAPYADQSLAMKIGSAVVALLLGAVIGVILTVTHQATVTVGEVTIPWGIISAIAITIALLLGLRIVFETRIVPGLAAAGLLLAVALLSLQTSGGSILVPANLAGYTWTFAPTLIALVVLAWPRVRRAAAGRIVPIRAAKGDPDQ